MNKGFTLFEIVIVIILFLIISLALFGILSAGRESWYTASAQIELQQEARRAMDAVVKQLRETGSTHVSITGGDNNIITFQIPVDVNGDGDILDSNGNIEWGAGGQQGQAIQYYLGGTDTLQLLSRLLDGYPSGSQIGGVTVLANNIYSSDSSFNALRFTGTPSSNPTVIDIEITAEEKESLLGRTMRINLQSKVRLRN
jgi:type II secretory pathway pseudopilin PulG